MDTRPGCRRWAGGIALAFVLCAAAVLWWGLRMEVEVRDEVVWEHPVAAEESAASVRWGAAAVGETGGTVIYVTDAHRGVVYRLHYPEDGVDSGLLEEETIEISEPRTPVLPVAAGGFLMVYDPVRGVLLSFAADDLIGGEVASPQGESSLKDLLVAAMEQLVDDGEFGELPTTPEALADFGVRVRQLKSDGEGRIWLLADLTSDAVIHRLVVSWSVGEVLSADSCSGGTARWLYLARMEQGAPFWQVMDVPGSERLPQGEADSTEGVYHTEEGKPPLIDVSVLSAGCAVLRPGDGPLQWEISRRWGGEEGAVNLRGREGTFPHLIAPSAHGVWVALRQPSRNQIGSTGYSMSWEVFLLDATGDSPGGLEIHWPRDCRQGPIVAPAGEDLLLLLHPVPAQDKMILRAVWVESRWLWDTAR